MALIELTDVSKTFPGLGWKALDRVSLSVEAGEIAGILGPSGCGKSTLLNIIAGLDEGFEGRATIRGRPIREQLARGFRVAYVFQEPRLMPWRTVRQNIEFVLEAAKFPKFGWRETTDHTLGLVELGSFAEFYPQQLSGGMQQRVSIARAFAIEPDILLMDEPFSALDELTARRLRERLLTLWAAYQTTILFVSHNAFESTFLADRVHVMGKGPGGRIREEIGLGGLPRPRAYDDTAVFEHSKHVVDTLIRHAGHDFQAALP